MTYPDARALLGYMIAPRDCNEEEQAKKQFRTFTQREADVTLRAGGDACLITLGTSDTYGVDGSNRVQVVLHGEVYEPVSNQAAWVAGCIASDGLTAVAGLRGSFALVVADTRHEHIAIVTDRLNSRRLFWSRQKGGLFISSELLDQPVGEHSIDPAGLAWYLSNGHIHNGRTLFDGIAVFDRAGIHQMRDGRLQTQTYWQFGVTLPSSRAPADDLRAELHARLVTGVERCLYDAPDVHLSLSGGYDASGLAGLLGQSLGVPNVTCISYVLGEPQGDSDEHVARRMADLLGYTHETVQSYEGDVLRHLHDNAAMGQGYAGCSDEVDAWKQLGRMVAARPRPVLFSGSACFGQDCLQEYGGTPKDDRTDTLRRAGVYGFERLDWLAKYLPGNTYDHMCAIMHREHDVVLDRCPATESPRDAKDYVFLDQRLVFHHMPWWECYASRYLPVRTPLLDYDVLDFVATLPEAMRADKRLYREVVTSRYPRLFTIPRARRGNYKPDLKAELARNASTLREHLTSTESALDDVLAPDVALTVLDHLTGAEALSTPFKYRAIEAAKRVLSPRMRALAKSLLPLPVSASTHLTTSPADFLRRYLVARIVTSSSIDAAAPFSRDTV